DVYELFQGKSAIIIDARDLEAYESGHITGAWNIPYHKFLDRLELLDPLPLDTLIITYCDGENCNASIELANALVSMGFSNIRYYFGGWNAWLKDNYPITSGSAQ
ncbi:MAG: rhodanese, partial [Candidatus Marinimicrobia bacterium CG_4_9_14_3_um_filter_48_9]